MASTQSISSMYNITQNLNNNNETKSNNNAYATISNYKNKSEINNQINETQTVQQSLQNPLQIHEIKTLVAEGPQFKNYQPMEVIDLQPNILHFSNIQSNINILKQKNMISSSDQTVNHLLSKKIY